MKLYILKHPTKGYLTSNKSHGGSWSDDMNKATTWTYLNHPRNLIKQTSSEEKRECKIIMLEFNQEPNITELT